MIEKDTSPDKLAGRLTELMENPLILQRAAACALGKNQTRGAEDLAQTLATILKEKE